MGSLGSLVFEVEFKSLQAVLDMAKKKPAADGPTYAPEMTYIVVSKKELNGSGPKSGILRRSEG